MNETKQNKPAQEEIDLGYLFKKINDFFIGCVKLLFSVIAFLKKYAVILVLLIVLGFAYGFYKDYNTKKDYNNISIVIPNLESADYLYDKVKAVNSKMELGDTTYLKAVIGPNYYLLKRIEIEPIADIYSFISETKENLDIFRVLAQSQNIENYLEELKENKNYKYHKLNFLITGREYSPEIVSNVFNYVNENEHYNSYLEVNRENTVLQLAETEKMIAQADSVIKAATANGKNIKSDQSVFITDNSQLDALLTTKQTLLEDRLELKMKLTDEKEVIKEVSTDYNINVKKGFSISNKVKWPLLLVLIFSGAFFLRYIYLKLKSISEEN